MVPMLTCGLVRSNLALATGSSSGRSCRDCRALDCDRFATGFDSQFSREGFVKLCVVRGPPFRTDPGLRAYSPLVFWMISSATALGTSEYESNSIEYTARPEVFERRSPM